MDFFPFFLYKPRSDLWYMRIYHLCSWILLVWV